MKIYAIQKGNNTKVVGFFNKSILEKYMNKYALKPSCKILEIEMQDNLDVFVLENGTYSDKHVIDIFESKELADKFVLFKKAQDNPAITKYTVVDSVEFTKEEEGKLKYVYTVVFEQDGRIIECNQVQFIVEPGEEQDSIVEHYGSKCMTVSIYESIKISEEAAKKIAIDRRTKYLANKFGLSI